MRNVVLAVGTSLLLILATMNSHAEDSKYDQGDLSSPFSTPSTENNAEIIPFASPADGALLAPINPNAYGPGINSDATGRPFIWQPQGSTIVHPDPTLKVTPNAYGPGVGMDQYGRPVRPQNWP